MKFAVSVLAKGLIYAVCFVIIAALALYLFGVKNEFSFCAGEENEKIISVAGDGNGNAVIDIFGKSVQIKRGDLRSLGERIIGRLK